MLTIKNGLNAPDGFLTDVYEKIDKVIYKPALQGTLDKLIERYNTCKDSFILLYDGDELIGYINFFPVTEKLNAEMTNKKNPKMYDDDISSADMHDWDKSNHVFILSVAILQKYRKSNAIIELSNAFLKFLKDKNDAGFEINSISGYAISVEGVKFIKRFRGSVIKHIECPETKELYHFLYTPKEDVNELLDNGLLLNSYKKTYDDDLYFFVPMTSKGSIENEKSFSKLLDANIRQGRDIDEFGDEPMEDFSDLKFGDLYCKTLNQHINYECTQNHFKPRINRKGEKICPIRRLYLGEFSLACYDDDYDNIPLAEETAHLFVTTHKYTGIYIVTLAIKDNFYNPSQLIDQMSTDHLEIKDPKTGNYVKVGDYFNNYFNLEICGESKCVVCLGNEPQEPYGKTELAYLLSGETMISKHIDYKIKPEHRNELTRNRAIYDYYDSYISRSVIAFVFKTYSDDISERIDREASELFIVEIVLFQNTSVLRTNRKVVEELYDSEDISNENINALYVEFGKTSPFWDTDIFKYPFSQKEANEVIESFGIKETLATYHQNQRFLDRLIELRSNIEEKKSDDRMNNILFFLSFFEAGSITVAVVLWIFYFLNADSISFSGDSIIRITTVILIIIFAIALYFSATIKKGIKNFLKWPKKRK